MTNIPNKPTLPRGFRYLARGDPEIQQLLGILSSADNPVVFRDLCPNLEKQHQIRGKLQKIREYGIITRNRQTRTYQVSPHYLQGVASLLTTLENDRKVPGSAS